jgi:hypothetical protein
MRKYIFIILLLTLSASLTAQSIKRSSIGFYATSSNGGLLGTSGQISSGYSKDSSQQYMLGFQQPISFPVNTQTNYFNDTLLCPDNLLVLKATKNILYTWYKNDTIILQGSNDSITINSPGLYRFEASDGILKYESGKPIAITHVNTSAVKSAIKGFSIDTTVCFFDTISINSAIISDAYRWSTSDTAKFIVASKEGTIYLQNGIMASKNNYCFSDTSAKIRLVKNLAPIPSIIRVADDLVSEQSLNYKWFFNNILLPSDTINTLKIKTKGLYQVQTSLDKFCWSKSPDYLVQIDPVSVLQKEFQLSAYPNPTTGIFFLQLKLDKRYSGMVQILILDALGNLKWKYNHFVFNDASIRIPFNLILNKGVYTINVNLNGYKSKAIQIIGL